ncbi:MAG: TonB-dependent receptor [Sphingomonadaceae bacterium]
MPQSKRRNLLKISTALAAVTLASHAAAQDSPTDNFANATESASSEIVVTAQRRSERLVDVPISISSVSGEALESSGTSSLYNLTQNVPGLRLDSSGPYVIPTIRGVGSSLSGPGLSSNIAVYMDGYYIPNQLGSDFQLLGISNVQVLKGPQGTLFGRNSTGGAILVTTKDPTFNSEATIRASYASFDRLNLSFYGSTGLTDKLAINLTGFYEQGDGYVRNVNTGNKDSQFDKWSVRSKLLFEPSDAAEFVLTYGHSYVNDPSPYVTSNYEGMSAGNVVPGVEVADGRRVTSNGIQAGHRFRGNNVSLTGDFDVGFASLKSYTQYRRERSAEQADYDGTELSIFEPDWRVIDRTVTQELNLSSNEGGPLSWVLGLYYYNNRNAYRDFGAVAGGSPRFKIFDTTITNESWAGFADATYEITPGLFLTGGLRYGRDKVKGHYDLAAGPSDGASRTFNNLSPRVIVRYEIDNSTNVYASYNRGYKAGFLPIASFATSPEVKPEHIDAFEVGLKTAQGPIRAEASAFYYNYKALQVAAYIGVNSIFRNAATSRIWGLDGQVSANITDNFDISLAGTYTNAEYRNFEGAVAYAQDLNPASPTYGLFNTFAADASGMTMPRSPKFIANAGAHYQTTLADGRLDLNANFYYTTRFYYDPIHQFGQGAYALVGLRATYTSPDERWAYSVYGTNITNSSYRSQVLPGTYAIQQTFGEPAAVGASITLNF